MRSFSQRRLPRDPRHQQPRDHLACRNRWLTFTPTATAPEYRVVPTSEQTSQALRELKVTHPPRDVNTESQRHAGKHAEFLARIIDIETWQD